MFSKVLSGRVPVVRRNLADSWWAAPDGVDIALIQVGNPADYLLNVASRNGSWGRPVDMPGNR